MIQRGRFEPRFIATAASNHPHYLHILGIAKARKILLTGPNQVSRHSDPNVSQNLLLVTAWTQYYNSPAIGSRKWAQTVFPAPIPVFCPNFRTSGRRHSAI
jgi:hypothetical protein